MPTFDGPDGHVSALLEIATQAQYDGNYELGITTFAEALLEQGGVEPPEGYESYRLSKRFGRLVGQPLMVAEVALPKGLIGWNVQRVRVDQLEVGRNKRLPGYRITERFHLGTVDTTIVGPEDSRTIAIQTRGNMKNTVFRNVGSPQDVCSVMNLAAHQGSVVPRERIGKRTPREVIQTAGAYLGYLFVEAMTAEDD